MRQIQQLGVTPVSDANQRRHLFIIDLTLGELITTSLSLAWPARGTGSLYQNFPKWKGKDFFNHRQGKRIEGQNKRPKDLEGITSDTSKNSWDLQSRGEMEWEAQEIE